jgi:hypothetical protein
MVAYGNAAISVFRQTNSYVRHPEKPPTYFTTAAIPDPLLEETPANLSPECIQVSEEDLVKPLALLRTELQTLCTNHQINLQRQFEALDAEHGLAPPKIRGLSTADESSSSTVTDAHHVDAMG